MSSSKLNRKTNTAGDASIDIGDRSQSRDNFLSIKRVNGVSSQVKEAGFGGLKWTQKGGGYYSECNKRLKG
jgi:hypothetical protein